TVEKPTGAPLTGEGRLLGTFQYMAPEQLEGKEADARTDIFALGSLLYEMTTGKRAFAGASTASLIAAILEKDPPPMAALQPMTPPTLDRLVRTCLAKDPDERWQNAHDGAAGLQWAREAASIAAQPSRRERLAWSTAAVTGVVAAIAVLLAVRASTRPPAPNAAHKVVSSILPPVGAMPAFEFDLALAPDGRHLAFTAVTPDGRRQLWVRSMRTGEARPIADTDDAGWPFWSPDGRTIGFSVRGKLKKIAASGGPVQTLCSAGIPTKGTWGADDVILFHGQQAPTILQVSAGGG